MKPEPKEMPAERRIPLTKGQVAIVDLEDYEALSRYRWHAIRAHGGKYKAAHSIYTPINRKHKNVLMHRFILGVTDPKIEVDHRDGNPLNNRRSNLRLATHQQNQWNAGRRKDNTSGIKGVRFDPDTNKWTAHIRVNGKEQTLGWFADKAAAGVAYAKAAIELRGEFARYDVAALAAPAPGSECSRCGHVHKFPAVCAANMGTGIRCKCKPESAPSPDEWSLPKKQEGSK